MTGLKGHNWKDRYTTGDDIVDSFYNPALSRSRYYYRIAGYFSSSAIAVACNGFSNFVENGEKIFMIIGNSVTEKDMDAMNRGDTNKEELLREKWARCLEELRDNSWYKGRFKALAWLLAHDKLEIKIGINIEEDGSLIPSEKSYFHEKIIIFEDHDGNKIHTEGSINESAKGWRENRESFSVHRSWIEGQTGHIESAQVEFDKLWKNEDSFSEVFEIPEALKRDIVSFADSEPPPIESYTSRATGEAKTDGMKLRRYQKEAIEAWIAAGKTGILEMATGTGKTVTALYAVKPDCIEGKILVVVVPQKELVSQWTSECEKILGNNPTLECHSGNSDWKEHIRKFINLNKNKFSVIVTLKHTFMGDTFQNAIRRKQSEIILIFDEVHEMGSNKAKEVFSKLDNITIKLGLSATPSRWDEAGNIAIRNFFEKDEPVYVFNLDDAIKPKDGYEKSLCDYNYYISTCSLNDEELDNYRSLTEKISREISKKKKDENFATFFARNANLRQLIYNRMRITKGCESRLDLLFEIINENASKLKKCILYCNNIKEVDEVTSNLLEMGYNAVKYHSRLTDARNNNLESFKHGNTQFIVAVGCLDQGVDIPICDSAVITSSSQNPREYIQRRGRILRLMPNKDKVAEIFDIVVLPYDLDDLERGRVFIDDIESNIIRKQLNRAKTFTRSARNSDECFLRILKLEKLVNVYGSLD